jgi:predicted ATPase/class 3 adenylate cyclase
MIDLPSGTVTFLFTDIEGSTQLWEQQPEAMKTALARHDAILREAVESNQGGVIKTTGDGCLAVFSTAIDAARASLAAQRGLSQTSEGSETSQVSIRVRIGIHTGEAEERAGDYFGQALNRAARLMGAGHGGQILLSRTTADLVREHLPADVSLLDLGEHRLKDLTHPEHIYQVNAPGLPSTFPALKTLDAQLNNLPSQPTPFIGREREIAAVLGLLRNPAVRLVTLTGAGGTGKTRLSLQVAAEVLDEFEHGVWFVELASIPDPELVLPSIAATLRVKESAGTTLEQSLQDHLRNKQLLLALDNFEQVVSAAPKIVPLLNTAPKIKIMVSSREVLHLRGEHDYPVPPLGLPETKRHQTAAVLAQYEAISLFVQHAQAANPSFVLDEDNASTVADICTRLDGLPLALELAAARSRLLKPAVMLEKLKNKLDILTRGARDLPRRQQTIRGAIDWSYDLLDEAEKVLFARLGVFVGGWTLEAAESVCSKGLTVDILNGLESLLDKSLIRQTEGASGETRFTMLETIREYAFEKLTQSGEVGSIQQAHAKAIADLLEKVRDATGGSDEVKWFAKLDDELDNLRSAVEWALADNQPALALLAGRQFNYWVQRVNIREPLQWLEIALAMPKNVPLTDRAYALNGAGNLSNELGDTPRAKGYYQSALALFHETNNRDGISRCMNNLGNIAWAEKDFEKARQLYEESLMIEKPVSFGASMTLNNLGSLARIRGDWEQSREYYLRSREICERLEAEAGVSYATLFLATVTVMQRDLNEARTLYESGLKANWIRINSLFRGYAEGFLGYVDLLTGNTLDARGRLNQSLETVVGLLDQLSEIPEGWLVIEGKARLELIDGHMQRAAQLFGVSWALREKDGYPLSEMERPDYETCINTICSALGDAAYNKAFEKGKAMTLKDAIDFALEESPK